jgi:hypothetical protein
MISVNHYFRPHQTLKNAKNIFLKIFYAETNEAMSPKLSIGGQYPPKLSKIVNVLSHKHA